MSKPMQYAQSFCNGKEGRNLCAQRDSCKLHHERIDLGDKELPVKSRLMTLPRVDGRECHFFVQVK